jgi:hypothetical protein
MLVKINFKLRINFETTFGFPKWFNFEKLVVGILYHIYTLALRRYPEAELLFKKLGHGPLFQSKISYITYIFYVLIVLYIIKWPPLNNFIVYFLIFILVGPFLFEPQAPLL